MGFECLFGSARIQCFHLSTIEDHHTKASSWERISDFPSWGCARRFSYHSDAVHLLLLVVDDDADASKKVDDISMLGHALSSRDQPMVNL
mmetsp:Transcript_15927/g.31996  ORF Transcript_15927/g.31996 Transcript_15927/m.31996 type:complete len:90 (+) Transcript_15927:461-730(+)